MHICVCIFSFATMLRFQNACMRLIVLRKCAHAYLCMYLCIRTETLTPKELFAVNPTKTLSNKDNIPEGAWWHFIFEHASCWHFIFLLSGTEGAIVLVKDQNGVDDAFGEVTNPYGKDVDVKFFDPPKNAARKPAPSVPEPVKRKYLGMCVAPRKKFTRTYPDGRVEEYHCKGYDFKGSHWEVWSKVQVIALKHDCPPSPPLRPQACQHIVLSALRLI